MSTKITKLKRCPLCNSTNTDADCAGYDGTMRRVVMDRYCNDCGSAWEDFFEYAGSDQLINEDGDEATFPPDRIMP